MPEKKGKQRVMSRDVTLCLFIFFSVSLDAFVQPQVQDPASAYICRKALAGHNILFENREIGSGDPRPLCHGINPWSRRR